MPRNFRPTEQFPPDWKGPAGGAASPSLQAAMPADDSESWQQRVLRLERELNDLSQWLSLANEPQATPATDNSVGETRVARPQQYLQQLAQSLQQIKADAMVANRPQAGCPEGIPESGWPVLIKSMLQETDSAVVVQKNNACVFANEYACRLINIDPKQALGQDILTGILADSDSYIGGGAQGAKWLLQRASEAGHCRTEITRLDGEGSEQCFNVLLQAACDGEDQYLIAFLREVTHQKILEKQLRSGRDFHNKLINSIPECFFVTDQDHRIVLCNDAFCSLLQQDRESLMYQSVWSVFSHEIASRLAVQGKTLLEYNLCETLEMPLLGGGSQGSIFSVRRSIFEDRESGQRFVVSSAEDVTDARRDQMQLKLLASVYRNAGEGIAILDQEGMFCEVNPAFVELTGFSGEEIAGKPIKTIFDAESIGGQAEIYMTQICQLSEWNDTLILRSKAGVCVHTWVSVNHVLDSRGELSHMIAIFSDMSEIHATQERLRYQAYHDPLTLLPSRAYFHERLREMLEECQNSGRIAIDLDAGSIDDLAEKPAAQSFAVMFMDLDDFKNVNDTMGHNMGDVLLQQVAERLKSCLGDSCFVSRFGGDEFAVLVPNVHNTDNDPILLARRIINEIDRPFDISGNKFFVGTSIGICQYPEHGNDMESLLQNSDTAMYRAKAAGKNQLRVYSHELSRQVRRRMTLASKLRTAVEQEKFSLVYQPKVELKSNRIRSCESLLRWQTDDGKFIPPSEFVPIAEETGLIEAIGEFVIHESCKAIQRWDGLGLEIDRIAINLSPRQFNHRFPETVISILQQHQISPTRIEFEITETVMMEDAQKSAAIIRSLSDLGIHFSIDDFGTGHSSLGYLKSFQVDAIKIDRTFIRDLPDDEDAFAIVQSILTLARSRKLPVVAEGVETYQQLELLRDEGCDFIQGYYFSKPLAIGEFEAFVAGFNRGPA